MIRRRERVNSLVSENIHNEIVRFYFPLVRSPPSIRMTTALLGGKIPFSLLILSVYLSSSCLSIPKNLSPKSYIEWQVTKEFQNFKRGYLTRVKLIVLNMVNPRVKQQQKTKHKHIKTIPR